MNPFCWKMSQFWVVLQVAFFFNDNFGSECLSFYIQTHSDEHTSPYLLQLTLFFYVWKPYFTLLQIWYNLKDYWFYVWETAAKIKHVLRNICNIGDSSDLWAILWSCSSYYPGHTVSLLCLFDLSRAHSRSSKIAEMSAYRARFPSILHWVGFRVPDTGISVV